MDTRRHPISTPRASFSPDESLVRQWVSVARFAPSGDNCQPWRYRWDGQRLFVSFDRSRAATFMDVHDRASLIALGAALQHIELAAAADGWITQATVGGRGAAIAFLSGAPFRRSLLDVVPHRHVNRRPYGRELLSDDALTSLLTSVQGAARVHIVTERKAVDAVADACATFDPLLLANREMHDYLFRWLRPGPAPDGIPLPALELAAPERLSFRLLKYWTLARFFYAVGAGALFRRRARGVYRRSAAFALFSVPALDEKTFVAGGEDMARFWLTATQAGVSVQPVTGFVFFELRSRLEPDTLKFEEYRALSRFRSAILGHFPSFSLRVPLMMFRLGSGRPASARSGRLPVDSVYRTGAPTREAL